MARWQANASLVFITLIWGTTFVTVSEALRSVGAFGFLAPRFWIAGLVLVMLFRGRLPDLTWGEVQAGAVIGLALSAGFIAQTVGLVTTAPGKSAFITGLNVVIVPFMAFALLGIPPRRAALLGAGLATAGLALLSLDASLRVGMGDLWTLAGAFAFALHIVVVSRYAGHFDPIRLSIVQIVTVALVTTAGLLLFERPSLALPGGVWAAIVFTAIAATALAYSVQIAAQRYTTPANTALIFVLEPVFAALAGWLLIQEQLGLKELTGGALILVGMLVAELADPRPGPATGG